MAIDIELMKIFAKSRRLRRLLMPTMFCALLVAVCLIRQLGFGSHEVRCDEKIESPQSEERQAMNDKTVSDTNSNEDQPQLLSDSIDVVSTKNDFEKVTESNLKANGLINLDVPSRRKVFRRKNMQTCEPVYGRIMVFTAMDDKSINVRYGFAQRSLECYLASTNYTFIQVNLDTDRRIQDHCKHKTAYFKKHCAAAYYLQDTDWMLILDADTGVVNPNHCLEEYIDDRVDMIFYERFFNWEIACGNYIVKNTAQSRQFLMEYANMESEPYKPGTWLGFDNGPLQILILKHVMPFAHHITNICNQIWHNSKNYDQYTAYLLCVKMALGEQRLWPGKVRIYKRAHAWVRDAWLSSDDWTDIDFMFHGWKIENLKEAKGYVSPFTQDFNVTECGRGYSGWHYNLDKKKTIQEMRTVFSNFEKERAKSHPKEGRTPYFLTVPDVGECYPHCEDL
ncbi:hypothetical protein QR680_000970 [Steinernema hermaphroditum]|uniref:Nucleotide-diphospho-sugar transferase domain-containing protein n=1 Tax=Steinernema hermaphroditum TaxID=289476 RepID=A0AA39GZA8_9BILA|nr:hypothetical protein QR680_000970 [Steinernema hermaphroditum]